MILSVYVKFSEKKQTHARVKRLAKQMRIKEDLPPSQPDNDTTITTEDRERAERRFLAYQKMADY